MNQGVATSLQRVDERLAQLESAAATLVATNAAADANGQAFLALVERSRAELVEAVQRHATEAAAEQAVQAATILKDLEEHSSKVRHSLAVAGHWAIG